MKTELYNGRRCASVEKFTELILNKSIPVVEDDTEEEKRPIAYAPPRDLDPLWFEDSTAIPVIRPGQFLSSQPPSSTFFGTFTKQTGSRSTFNNNQIKPGSFSRGVQQKMRSNGNNRQNLQPKQEATYRPESLASSAPTQKTYERLAEVYSSSGDTVQFAGNLRTFISERIPYGVWIGFAVIEILFGLILLFVGALNMPMCEIQPLIPVYLLVSGIILLIHGIVRIFVSIPSTPTSRRQQRAQGNKLSRTLCLYAIEGTILLFMIIVVVFGCVVVYGARYVHFHEGVFEEDYCNGFIYWAAWWSVTIHLTILSLLILAIIFFLIYGTCISN